MCKVKWMKGVDHGISFVVDLLYYITSNLFLSAICSVEHYNQSHMFLLSLWMQYPIRGVLIHHCKELWSCAVFIEFTNSLISINYKLQKRDWLCRGDSFSNYNQSFCENAGLTVLDWSHGALFLCYLFPVWITVLFFMLLKITICEVFIV